MNHKESQQIAHRPIIFMSFITILTTFLLSTGNSYSKYVIHTDYDITAHSVSAYTITAIGAINGSVQVGHALTAGALTPQGATVNYQWMKCATANGTYTNISGAVSNSYTPTTSDRNYFIQVSVTGTGNYVGTVTSAYTGPVTVPVTSIKAFSGTVQVGRTLTAGALTPSGATVTYQWQKCLTAGGTYTDIPGAVSKTYAVSGGDYNYYIRVIASGTGGYSGTVISAQKGPVKSRAITGIGSIRGTARVGQELTAGALTPAGANVTYQWKRCATSGGTYTNIPGATSNTYTLTASDQNEFIKVSVTGTDGYTGTVTSSRTSKVSAG